MCKLFVVYAREKTRKFLMKRVIIMHLQPLSNTISYLISLLAAFTRFHDAAEFSLACQKFRLEENIQGSTLDTKASVPTWEHLFQVCSPWSPARALHPSRLLQELNSPCKYYNIPNQQGWDSTKRMGFERHPGRVRMQIIKIGKRTKRSMWPDWGLKSTGWFMSSEDLAQLDLILTSLTNSL